MNKGWGVVLMKGMSVLVTGLLGVCLLSQASYAEGTTINLSGNQTTTATQTQSSGGSGLTAEQVQSFLGSLQSGDASGIANPTGIIGQVGGSNADFQQFATQIQQLGSGNVSPQQIINLLLSLFGRGGSGGIGGIGSSSTGAASQGNAEITPAQDEVTQNSQAVVTRDAMQAENKEQSRIAREFYGINVNANSTRFADRFATTQLLPELATMHQFENYFNGVSDNLAQPRSYVHYVLSQKDPQSGQPLLSMQGMLQSTRQLNFTLLKMLEQQALHNWLLTRMMQQANRAVLSEQAQRSLDAAVRRGMNVRE